MTRSKLTEKAVSQDQQQAAGAALAAKRGEIPTSSLKGASKEMYKMSEKELEKFASTKHKGLPVRKESKNASQIREKISRVVELMTKRYLEETKIETAKPESPINEYGRQVATQIIQDTVDDFLMETEMLIDDKYAEVGLPEFKKEWYSITKRFENKITNILKNMSTR